MAKNTVVDVLCRTKGQTVCALCKTLHKCFSALLQQPSLWFTCTAACTPIACKLLFVKKRARLPATCFVSGNMPSKDCRDAQNSTNSASSEHWGLDLVSSDRCTGKPYRSAAGYLAVQQRSVSTCQWSHNMAHSCQSRSHSSPVSA